MGFKLDFSKSRPLQKYKKGLKIQVHDLMQSSYSYVLSENPGEDFAPGFKPELSPPEMLKLGIFEGKYLNDCTNEFPQEWYAEAVKHLSPERPDIQKNRFKIKSRQSLKIWIQKEWILPGDPDVRGWFQWYCRYYLGRRIPEVDARQIKRWRAFRRHAGQIRANCEPGNLFCRPKQRQALLQWAYDPFI